MILRSSSKGSEDSSSAGLAGRRALSSRLKADAFRLNALVLAGSVDCLKKSLSDTLGIAISDQDSVMAPPQRALV